MRLATCLLAAALAACSSPQMSGTPLVDLSARPRINTIALAPDGGVLSDAVGIELSGRGFNVLDTAATSSLLDRLHLSPVDLSRRDGIHQLQGQGVDALLVIHAVAGADHKPEGASVRLTDTANGALIAGLTWQNGSAGASGSMADRLTRRGLTETAGDIASALALRVTH